MTTPALAFWDSSVLVPLCLAQPSSTTFKKLSSQYGMVVWWATPVEIQSAFARLLRMGQLSLQEHTQAQIRLEMLRDHWRVIEPSQTLRELTETLVNRFPLKAADAFQLAAALRWCGERAEQRVFLSADRQLLESARFSGFTTIAP